MDLQHLAGVGEVFAASSPYSAGGKLYHAANGVFYRQSNKGGTGAVGNGGGDDTTGQHGFLVIYPQATHLEGLRQALQSHAYVLCFVDVVVVVNIIALHNEWGERGHGGIRQNNFASPVVHIQPRGKLKGGLLFSGDSA